ncbi:MAG: class IIb bacteriocin, lactobin A/cerein 7B family [Rhodobacteraceae bacterium]|nr:class IIb bacteriocin, lactobin A/cerein 7B family [Paracoccaceae bacterium]
MTNHDTAASADDIVELTFDEVEQVSGGIAPAVWAAGIITLKLINIGVTVYRMQKK